MQEEYKILKLNENEIKILKMSIISSIVDLKIKQEKIIEGEEIKLENIKNSIYKYQSLLNIINYIER
jgi:hypothetical protein